MLVSMSGRPQARGGGVGEAVIDAIAGWAGQQGASTVHLWVTETNSRARLLYDATREKHVIQRKEIAQQLALSVKTIEVHKANAMRKLDLRGRVDIVRYAVHHGWLHDA